MSVYSSFRELPSECHSTSLLSKKLVSTYVQSKRNMKNFESIQQAFLIALLNKFGSFILERPIKRSKVTFQTLKVKSFSLLKETIEVAELVDSCCKARSEVELSHGISKERVKRRFDKNRFIFLSNLLLDIATELGYFFETKMARNAGGVIQLEKIRKTFYHSQLLFSQEEMMVRGVALNRYVFSLTDNVDKLGKLDRNDPIIIKILFDPIETVQRGWNVRVKQDECDSKE
ncbi:hypothetical protein EHI8A_192760 [Entamoeba histolytica HM-1:IMSS-B]|uniref:Uncharacterized protein n=6 Tax=Entamoeba histolytica TaxID=5759 RepID=C4M9B8_ENTH1|nr:hypothetical protein EHI_003950 [Entamoeba histolytica HM-1:IMSS]EMD44050.1 Hypothetical protein EHI5A_040180 [Entamoeba histolytica KU27]EMH72600.1 hypothetical protein EHI8A_192760 [Entamoeba histolytica HM-1:IMSS-B]EMS12532.1 hypothetical protein KM1_265300 [Entamoeba histolytica HM-3:IMSS]ENY59961.1 hypothetical protein EHI7A_168490 [Entamoeba histolytica HM-1:IMSS-A]GAT98252.1 hypothetical protein CL6EHI_003950 [Entamoeba histolytica]|eukprot:XP_648910.1 hypothetical protein EHI_003950 [Entamoeba histolytica HM-1:IMSS]